MTALLILAAAAAIAAPPAPTSMEFSQKTQDAGRVFPYVERFLSIPPAQQSDFTVAYYLKRNGQPAAGVGVVIIDNGVRIPVPVAEDGRIERLPTLAEVRAHAMVAFDVPDNTPMKVRIGLAPIAPPATLMDAPAVQRAIAQANTAIHRLAGIFQVGVPRLKSALFDGAQGGAAVMADGSTVALPVKPDGPYYQPSQLRGAVSLTFSKAAQHIDIQ
jgi:hypothetical protein